MFLPSSTYMMADRSVSVPVASEADGANTRRNSLGKASSSKSGKKDLPHYLQASSGSCHDFCKYGKHHEFEKKPRHPFQKRPKKKLVNDQYSVEIWEQGKKTPVVKLKCQHKLNAYTLDTREIIKQVSRNSVGRPTPENVTFKKELGAMLLTGPAERQSPARKVTPKKKTPLQQVLTKSAESHSLVSGAVSSEKKKSSIHGMKKASPPKPRTSPDLKPCLAPRVRKQDTSLSSEKLTISLKHAVSSKPNLSSDSLDVATGRKTNDITIGQRTRKTVMSVKKEQAFPRGSFSPKSSGSRFPRALPSKTSLSAVGRGFSTPRASLSSKVSLSRVTRGSKVSRVASLNAKQGGSKVISPMKNQKKIGKVNAEQLKVKQVSPSRSIKYLKEPNNDMVQEKTLYVIKMETENKYVDSDVNEKVSVESSPTLSSTSPRASCLPKSPSLSSHDEQDQEESEYCSTEAEEEPLSDNDETKNVEDAEVFESEYRGRHKNVAVVPAEDKVGQPVKLRFRRGKVVDILSETRSPRRLKFRRGRVLSQNQNLKSDGRVTMKNEGSDGNTNDHQIDSPKVVLRHQDVQGKKDAQGLFNNVIEETASKLVETRKSKVKALVGAFETVISLQDGKPSTNVVS